jgi:chorismate synthase
MNGNTFGKKFCITTFGESHGVAVGCVIDGCPAGIEISRDFIQSELDRRRPGQSKISTPRDEKDQIKILSGVSPEGISLGTPIAMLVFNADAKSSDYDELKNVFRPGHADFTYEKKYGIRDHRGGGRSSARETLARVAAGVIAKTILKKEGIEILAWTDSVYDIKCISSPSRKGLGGGSFFTKKDIESNIVRCPDQDSAKKMISLIEEVKKEGDSVGGTVRCVIKNLPVGLGEPVFDKFHAVLAQSMLSINACKGFEIGAGFQASKMKGSEHNDEFFAGNSDEISLKTNNAGGVLGGITSGADIDFRVVFKPTATIFKKQNTVNKDGENVEISAKGRHDPCIVPRAVPIVEAMAALVVVDFLLRK